MFLGEAAHISVLTFEATRTVEARSTSKQGLGHVLYKQTRSLSCRTHQIWEDDVEGNGGRETFLIQTGIIPALLDKLSSFLPAQI